MPSFVRGKLSSDRLGERIGSAVLLFWVLFFTMVILSYYILPEQLLKNKNPMQNWEADGNSIILTLQIFFYNMLSVGVIVTGSLFGQKKESNANYLSIGYLAFFVQICINGVVLGTWSFSMGDTASAPALISRILGTFDVVHRAGVWEMMGQMLITCALAQITIIRSNGKQTTTRKFKEIHLTRSEKLVLLLGFVMMLTGAIIESIAINNI